MRYISIFTLSACTGVGTGKTGTTGDTGPVDDWQPVVYLDEGNVCFESDASGVSVNVVVQDCMSSSCSRAFSGSCTATVDGTSITLTSDIRWEDNVGINVSCTDDCGIPEASCTIAGLADGTYTVTFGGATLDLVVPTTEPCDLFRR